MTDEVAKSGWTEWEKSFFEPIIKLAEGNAYREATAHQDYWFLRGYATAYENLTDVKFDYFILAVNQYLDEDHKINTPDLYRRPLVR